jgi:Beta-amyloid precursor protein C-terminus
LLVKRGDESSNTIFSTTFHFFSLSSIPQSFSVRRQIYGASGREGRNVYFTLAFAGVALMAAVFVGVAVAKYRASRSPHAQGFVEVDQVSSSEISQSRQHLTVFRCSRCRPSPFPSHPKSVM